MNRATETFASLLRERGHDFYGKALFHGEYSLYVLNESATQYVLGDGSGEAVSDKRDINVQFMLMKELLGFETVENGEYVLRPSKFDNHLRLNCLTLVSHRDWIFRVVYEEQDFYLGLTNNSAPADWEQVPDTDFYVKWVSKGEVTDVSHYWGDAPKA
jgi:hypothetical protein